MPPTSFTDIFGSKIHGPELNHHLKSPQIRAAETCLVARGDNQTINMLRQPPCRHILTGEYFFSAAQIVKLSILVLKAYGLKLGRRPAQLPL